jgi:hypothetical protein
MELLLWLAAQIIWVIWAVLSWLLLQLVWMLVWVTLPICIFGISCILLAERFLGKPLVRRWIGKHSRRLTRTAWQRTRKFVFALWAVPTRVLGWFVVFALWHAVLNLWRTPRWRPWRRAWRRGWGYA